MAGHHFAVQNELPPVGRYRVRVLKDSRKPVEQRRSLDIREFVNGDVFEGFTRRGIRLTTKEQVELMRDALNEALVHWDD